ncbi:MAG: Ig-like domain-containing protein, partial [Candidatus Staskawiczbacteria bacterium]|nr:Ig-like domain-containing protein [Candidatus Staskawiczbacteria bacterium]
RVTFEEVLDNTKDITVYARPTNSGSSVSIEVYPVYTDADGNVTQGSKLETVYDGTNPDFKNIDIQGKYRILLQNLQTPTDVFDLKISGNVDIDYIVDPLSPGDYITECGVEINTSGSYVLAGDIINTSDDCITISGDITVYLSRNGPYSITNESGARSAIYIGPGAAVEISGIGIINSGSSGIENAGTIYDYSGTLDNSGSGYGIYNNDITGTITNISGTINNNGNYGIYNLSTIADISGTVNIFYGGYGIYQDGGTITTFSGTLNGLGYPEDLYNSGTIGTISSSGYINGDINGGEVTTNNGIVGINNATIINNNGTVTNNNGSTITTNNGTVTDNWGTIGTNNLTVTTNSGTVTTNASAGTIGTNSGTLTNANAGTITINNASFATNNGTVGTNNAGKTITTNNGSIGINNGTTNTNTFTGTGYNGTTGIITGNAVFGVPAGSDTAYNAGSVGGTAMFYASTQNKATGTVTGTATFNNSASNLGTVTNAEVYSPSPKPIGGTANGTVNYYGYDVPDPHPAILVTGVTLNESSATITVGDTRQLTATVAPANADDKSVSWSSNNTLVATVNNLGLVTAVSAGSAVITVITTDGSFTATDSITVSSPLNPSGGYVSPQTRASASAAATAQTVVNSVSQAMSQISNLFSRFVSLQPTTSPPNNLQPNQPPPAQPTLDSAGQTQLYQIIMKLISDLLSIFSKQPSR